MSRGGPERDRVHRDTERVSSQHVRINELYAELREALHRGAHHNVIVCFARLRDVLHAHFEVEDRIYFPTVEQYRPEHGGVVAALMREHVHFRDELDRIDALVRSNALGEAREVLSSLVGLLLRHEEQEEVLLREMTRLSDGSAPLAPVEGPPVDPE